MVELQRTEKVRELESLARQVIKLTQARGLPIIERVKDGRVFSWPFTGLRETVAEHLDRIKDNVAESERIQKLAHRAGVLGTNAAVAKDAIIEALPFEFGIIRDVPDGEIRESGNVGVTFRGVRYQVSLTTDGSTSEAGVFEVDNGGIPEDDADLEELTAGLRVIIDRSVQDDLPPAA